MIKLRKTCCWFVSVLLYVSAFETSAANDSSSRLFIEPEFIERPPPRYPKKQERNGRAGAVEVMFMIDEEGKTFDVIPVHSSRSDFEKTAVDAVRNYRYTPAKLNGKTVSTRQSIVLYYEMEGQLANSVSNKFRKRYKYALDKILEPQADETNAQNKLERLWSSTQTRCEHALFTLLSIEYSLPRLPISEEIALLRTATIYDSQYSGEAKCLTSEQLAYVKTRLMKVLLENQLYGDALREYATIQELKLTNVENLFEEAVNSIAEWQSTGKGYARKIVVPARGFYVTELLKRKFSLSAEEAEIDQLNLRCKSGYHRFDRNKDNFQYSIPDGLTECQLHVVSSPGSKFTMSEF